MGFRVTEELEVSGIDLAEHAETAYDLVPRGGRVGGMASAHATATMDDAHSVSSTTGASA